MGIGSKAGAPEDATLADKVKAGRESTASTETDNPPEDGGRAEPPAEAGTAPPKPEETQRGPEEPADDGSHAEPPVESGTAPGAMPDTLPFEAGTGTSTGGPASIPTPTKPETLADKVRMGAKANPGELAAGGAALATAGGLAATSGPPKPTTPAPTPAPIPEVAAGPTAPSEEAAPTAPVQAAAAKAKTKTPKAPPPPSKVDNGMDALREQAKQTGDSSLYTSKINKLDELADLYRKEYQSNRDRVGVAQVGEVIGQALSKIGAGIQGARTGFDTTSHLKFDKTDWSKQYETALEQLRTNLSDLQRKSEEATGLEKERQAGAQAAGREVVSQEQQTGRERETQQAETGREHERSATQKDIWGARVAGRSSDTDKRIASQERIAGLKNQLGYDKMNKQDQVAYDKASAAYQSALASGDEKAINKASGYFVDKGIKPETLQSIKSDATSAFGDKTKAQDEAAAATKAPTASSPAGAGQGGSDIVYYTDPKNPSAGQIPVHKDKLKEAEARGLVPAK